MTEKSFYKNHLRPALHNPPEKQVYRIEDYGMPDVMVAHREGLTFYELKTLDHMPVRSGTPFRVKYTTEQKRTLQSINEATGHDIAFFMVAVDRERRIFLFLPDIDRELDADRVGELSYVHGSFSNLQDGGWEYGGASG